MTQLDAYGQCLIGHARAVLSELALARDELQGLASGGSGSIRVGVLATAALELLPRALAAFKAKQPGVFVLIRAYLHHTNAIAALATDVSRYYESLGLLAILPLELPKLVRPVGIIWNRQRPISPGTQALMHCLEAVALSASSAQSETISSTK